MSTFWIVLGIGLVAALTVLLLRDFRPTSPERRGRRMKPSWPPAPAPRPPPPAGSSSEIRLPRWPPVRRLHQPSTIRLVVPAEHSRARLRSIVRRAVQAIETAPPGERLRTVHERCFAVGQLLDAASMSIDDVAPALEASAVVADQDPRLVRLVLEASRKAPRGVSDGVEGDRG